MYVKWRVRAFYLQRWVDCRNTSEPRRIMMKRLLYLLALGAATVALSARGGGAGHGGVPGLHG